MTPTAFEHPPRALVTGGASGIGLAIARRLLEVGGRVVIGDLPAPLSRLPEPGRNALEQVEMDVTDEASVRAGVADAVERMGGLDTLVNSAGICRLDRIEDVSTNDWTATIAINLTGTFLVLREALPHLRASGSGRVVNIASNASKRGYPYLAAYCASKFGVVGLTQSIAAEVAPDGVRVNAICPSTIEDTGVGQEVIAQRLGLGQAASADELRAQRLAEIPLGRLAGTGDVTEAALFLLSDAAGFITGEALNIDGGALSG